MIIVDIKLTSSNNTVTVAIVIGLVVIICALIFAIIFGVVLTTRKQKRKS